MVMTFTQHGTLSWVTACLFHLVCDFIDHLQIPDGPLSKLFNGVPHAVARVPSHTLRSSDASFLVVHRV